MTEPTKPLLSDASPTFDSDGYPTHETLTRIACWPYATQKERLKYLAGELENVLPFDPAGWLEFCRKAWHWPNRVSESSRQPGRWRFHTGGWSGNEMVIDAMEDNTHLWSICAVSWRRGGHYVFEAPY